jgi:energy-coupling factor transporter ATP-binding protein EcfA2
VNRAVRILIILGIGSLVVWEVVAQGTRTWVKYGLLKQPLPSLTTLLPTSLITTVLSIGLLGLLIATTLLALAKSRQLFGLVPLSELTRHIVVLGPTGTGKTTITKMIIEKVTKVMKSRSPSIIILDWKGEYRHFIPSATVVRKVPNIWDVAGDSPREKALVMVELLREMSKDVVEITPASSLLLLRVLEEEYGKGVPTTQKIIDILERSAAIAQREGKFAESNMYMALIRRLYVVLIDEERQAENVAGDPRVVIYDLGSLPSVYIKTLYCDYIISKIYRETMKSGKSDELKMLLVAEEAQNYIHQRRASELPSMAERLIYEIRGFGVGVVLVCPDSELLPAPVLKDVGAVVAMGPDSLPRFVLERHLFRASLEEAEDTLKKLKKSRMVVYYKNQLHFFRKLPKPPKELRLRPKGDRMGVTDSGVGSLRAWPILPHRSPGRPAPKVEVKEEKVEEKPKVIEVKVAEERTEVESKAVEAERPKAVEAVEPLRLEEEELEEEPEVIEVKEPETIATEPVEKKTVEEAVIEIKEEIDEKLSEEMPLEEPEPTPKGPPIPSLLPYRGSLCPAGRPHLTPVH